VNGFFLFVFSTFGFRGPACKGEIVYCQYSVLWVQVWGK